jgi:hypothetical protein
VLHPAVASSLPRLPCLHTTPASSDPHSSMQDPTKTRHTAPQNALSLALHQQDTRHTTKKTPCATAETLCSHMLACPCKPPAACSSNSSSSCCCCCHGRPTWCEAER